MDHDDASNIQHGDASNESDAMNISDTESDIDGLPMFKSSGWQMWPILCQIMQFDPFVVALYYVLKKPHPI